MRSLQIRRTQLHSARYLNDSLKTQYDKTWDATGALMRQLDALIDGAQLTAALRATNPGGAYASMYAASTRRAMAFGASLEDRLDQLAGVGAEDAVFNLGVKMHSDKLVLPPMLTPHQDSNHEWAACNDPVRKPFCVCGRCG
jgi:hypothetical protein